MSDLVLQERQGAVAILTLNRPERHNSLVPELLQAFLDALLALDQDGSVRAVVLQANGRSFSTGGDALGFVEHADNIEAYARQIVGLLNESVLAMIDLHAPVVVAVHGLLTGGSLGFVIGADLVLVAPEATFAPYYSEVGPSPDGGWAVLLPLLIGRKRAAELLYLNEHLDAEAAVVFGLANRVVPAGQIRAEALALAQEIAAKKPGSIRHTKRLLHCDRDELARRLQAELDHFLQQIVTDEAINGFRDFVQALSARERAQQLT